MKKSAIERLHLSFERFAGDLADGLQPAAPDDTEHSVLIEEVKVVCTTAMLQCLDRPHRLAYVLGEIMDFSGPEAAEALGISPTLFRKRLQHARRAILEFTRTHCGLVSDTAACRCNRRVTSAALAEPDAAPLRSLPAGPPPSRRPARWCARSTRRAGPRRCIATASRGPPRSTSPTA